MGSEMCIRDSFHTYGTWEAGQAREGFRRFADRRRAANGAEPGKLPAPEKAAKTPDRAARESEKAAKAPDKAAQAPAKMQPIPVDSAPLPPASKLQRPPFRFYLFGADYRALLELAPYKPGDAVQADDQGRLQPIAVDGRTVAFYSPFGKVNYSDLDVAYIAAMRDSLIAGAVFATVLALLLGLGFGSRLRRRLNRLTRAVRAIEHGELQQHVAVTESDEIGELAAAFNLMSDTLAASYKDLQDSRERIRQQAEQLRELSVQDALTNLYNRRYFDAQGALMFERAVRYGRPLSVMLADIDHFKNVNDTFGHAMGDEVLRRIGELLASKVRTSDIVARYGGEEFVIAFPETALTQAAATCEMLRQRIESYPWDTMHPELKVTISMGLSADTDVDNMAAMVENADKLLYRAKQSGRNRVCTEGTPG